MAGPENPNSENMQEEGGGGGRGKKLLILVFLVVLLAGAGGGGYFYFFRQPADGDETAKESTDKEKKSKSKKSKKSGDEDAEEKSAADEPTADADVKNVVDLQPFIVNLADTEQARYLRLNVSVGVAGGEGEKPDQLFVTRVRNAMLAVLSAKSSEEVLSSEGKAKLRRELLKAAQKASAEPEVLAIYITDFIVQM